MCLCHMLLVLTLSNNHSIAPSSWEGLQSRLGGLTGLQRGATIYQGIKGCYEQFHISNERNESSNL